MEACWARSLLKSLRFVSNKIYSHKMTARQRYNQTVNENNELISLSDLSKYLSERVALKDSGNIWVNNR